MQNEVNFVEKKVTILILDYFLSLSAWICLISHIMIVLMVQDSYTTTNYMYLWHKKKKKEEEESMYSLVNDLQFTEGDGGKLQNRHYSGIAKGSLKFTGGKLP